MVERERESGLKDATNRVWASLMEGVTLRLELFEAELQEERQRVVSMAMAAGLAVFFSVMTFLSLNVLILVRFWDRRVLVALCLTGVYLLGALVAGGLFRWRKRRSEAPFAASRQVFQEDRIRFGRGSHDA